MGVSLTQLGCLTIRIAMSAWLLKSLIVAILSSIYVIQGRPKNHIQDWITQLGSIGRGLGPSCMMTSAIFVMLFMAHYLPTIMYREDLDATENTGLILFLADEKEDRSQRSRIIDTLLDGVQNSNQIHQISLREYGPKLGLTSNYPILMGDDSRVTVARSLVELHHKPAKWSPVGAAHSQENARALIENLKRQSKHISYLSQDKSAIWPETRTSKWRRIYLNVWFAMHVLMYISIWMLSTFGSAVGLMICRDHLRNNNGIEESVRRFTWRELNDCFFIILYSWFHLDWYVEPIVFALTNLIDRSLDLGSVIAQYQQLIDELTLLDDHLDSSHYNHASRKVSLGLQADLVQELGWYFDQRAMEMYISVQMLSRETLLVFRRARAYLVYGFLLNILMITFFLTLKITEQFESRLWDSILVFCLANINLGIYPCAKFAKSCEKIIKSTHSLVAANESVTMRFKYRDARCDQHLITPHTVYLWRRYIADPSITIETFSCRLLGNKLINFETVLQLNTIFAYISIVLIRRGIF